MFFHFLFNKRDRFGRDITAEVVEAGKLPQEGKEGVTHATSQFGEVAYHFILWVQLSEISDFDHLSF